MKFSKFQLIFSNFPQFRRNSVKFSAKNMRFEPIFSEISQDLENHQNFARFCENLKKIEFEAVQKYANLVDL